MLPMPPKNPENRAAYVGADDGKVCAFNGARVGKEDDDEEGEEDEEDEGWS